MAGLMGLNWRQQKELLKLRGKLSFRQFMGEKARLLTAITSIMILTPVTIGLAVATGAGYFLLPDQWPTQLLGFVFLISWLIWCVAPVLSFNVNEGLDPTRLLNYPISHRDFLAHMLLGTLLDYPTYFLAPFAIAVVVGFGLGWSLPVVLIAIFFTYLLMVLTSQTIINTLGGVLRSRRFRDVTIVIGAFFGFGCWLISTSLQEIIPRVMDRGPEITVDVLMNLRPLEIMKWLPPGAAAKAIEQADSGAWGGSLLWLGYTLVWVVLFGWVWWRVTQRVVTGGGFIIGRGPAPEKEKQSKSKVRKGSSGLSWDWFPADIRSIALKDLKMRWRTPQSRIGLLYMFLMPVFLLAYPLFFGSDQDDTPFVFSKLLLAGGIIVYTMFVFWTNGQNMLGWETTGLSTLLLMPISRQRLFFGKTAAQFMMNGLPILILIVVAIFTEPSLVSISLLPTSIALGLACMSVLSIASVLFPYPVNTESQSGQNPFSRKGSCLTGIANTTLVPMALAVSCAPIVLPLALALYLEWDWVALIGSFLTLVYAVAHYYFGTRLADRLFLEREPEILIAASFQGK